MLLLRSRFATTLKPQKWRRRLSNTAAFVLDQPQGARVSVDQLVLRKAGRLDRGLLAHHERQGRWRPDCHRGPEAARHHQRFALCRRPHWAAEHLDGRHPLRGYEWLRVPAVLGR